MTQCAKTAMIETMPEKRFVACALDADHAKHEPHRSAEGITWKDQPTYAPTVDRAPIAFTSDTTPDEVV